MENLNLIISNNIKTLRKEKKITQMELAEKLNYSNKAISRWEAGEIIPDVPTLNKISEVFEVPLSSLLEENLSTKKVAKFSKQQMSNRLAISLLSVLVVWFIATVVFVYSHLSLWQAFIWAVPVSCIVGIVFNSIWGKKFGNFILISTLVWSLLLAIYCTIISLNIWPIFLIGIPSQIGIILAFNISKTKKSD